jgi:hypothetical protein
MNRRTALKSTLALLAALWLPAAAHDAHQHAAATAELGTSAAMDAHGRLWAVARDVTAAGAPTLVLRTSADLGAHWSAPRQVVQEAITARGEERPKLAFGPRGELYLLYTSPAGAKNPHLGDIRFVRSTDGGRTFSAPLTVHANRDAIVHSFGAMIVDREGRLFVAWIDNRGREAATARGQPYAGNALYYAVSDDGGRSFRGDYPVADNSCECCRIALALNPQGRPVAMWRHVYTPNVRDHALAELGVDGKPGPAVRVTFDDWRVDACPHHGPSLSYGADGARHQVWFNGKEGAGGGVQYARAGDRQAVTLGGAQAEHADVLASGRRVAVVWKEFDGQATAIRAKLSADGGRTWRESRLAATTGDSDKPFLIDGRAGPLLVWRTRDEGIRVLPAFGAGK